MASKYDLYAVSKIEYGDPGDGVVGTVFDTYDDIKDGTCNINIPKRDVGKIYTETNREVPYRTYKDGEGMYAAEFGLLGVPFENLPDFLGGSQTAAGLGQDEKFIFPGQSADIYKSVRIWTRETVSGKNVVFEFAYARITAGIDGALTFNDVLDLNVRIEAQVPVSAAGVEGDALALVLEGSATT